MQIMRLDLPLDGSVITEENRRLAEKKGKSWNAKKLHRASELAGNFLDVHKTVKIVIVLDTHCLNETGGFVYKGSGPESYGACTMEEVSDACCQS